jgi:hypothetical protein
VIFHPPSINRNFRRFLRNFGKLPTISKVFIHYYLIALDVGVGVTHGSGHMSKKKDIHTHTIFAELSHFSVDEYAP